MRAAHHALDRVDRRAGGQQRDLVRLGRRVGVGIELPGASGRLRDLTQVLAIVDPRELLGGRRARRDDFGAALAPAVGDGVHDFGALGALGMAGRRLMFGETIGRDQDDGHGD